MTQSEYERVFREGIARFGKLDDQREEIEIELTKLKKFLSATIDMVSDERKPELEKWLEAVVGKSSARTVSLAESIRQVFKNNPVMAYSTGGIRQELTHRGFDFSGYKSNPLSSIATTLRRMAETGELITTETLDGTTMFAPLKESQEKEDPERARRDRVARIRKMRD